MQPLSRGIIIFPPEEKFTQKVTFSPLRVYEPHEVKRLVGIVNQDWFSTSTDTDTFLMTHFLAEMQAPYYKRLYQEIIPEGASVEEVLRITQQYVNKHTVRATVDDMKEIYGTTTLTDFTGEEQYFTQYALDILENTINLRDETEMLKKTNAWIQRVSQTREFPNHRNILFSDARHFPRKKGKIKTPCLPDLSPSAILAGMTGHLKDSDAIIIGGPDHYGNLIQGKWFIDGKNPPLTKDEWNKKVSDQPLDPEQYFRKTICTPSIMIQLGTRTNVQGVEEVWRDSESDMYETCENFFGFKLDPGKYYSSESHQEAIKQRRQRTKTGFERANARAHQLSLQAQYARRKIDVPLPEVYLSAAYCNPHTLARAASLGAIDKIIEYVKRFDRAPAFEDEQRLALPGEIEQIGRASGYEAALATAALFGALKRDNQEGMRRLNFVDDGAEVFMQDTYVRFENNGSIHVH